MISGLYLNCTSIRRSSLGFWKLLPALSSVSCCPSQVGVDHFQGREGVERRLGASLNIRHSRWPSAVSFFCNSTEWSCNSWLVKHQELWNTLQQNIRLVCVSLCFPWITNKTVSFLPEFCPPSWSFSGTDFREKTATRWIQISLSLASRGDEPAEVVSLGFPGMNCANCETFCVNTEVTAEDFSIWELQALGCLLRNLEQMKRMFCGCESCEL